MAKILSFRNKGDAPSGQDFLTDENQTLSFRMTEDGGFSLGGLTRSGLGDFFPDPKKDWSNQELADLFRVRQLLSSANVPVETDRGVTDEGDPWFVFCHANGEVFIHLCRIDGLYVLDSPNVLRPLRGSDFNELIADFTNQAIPAGRSEDDPERRVIRLERGGKVRLHPSAMLAALIWTLFLASEELVLLAPEENETDSDALLNFDGMFAVETTSDTAVDLFFDQDTLDWAQMAKESGIDADHILHDSPAQMRDAHHQQQGLTTQTNAFSLGLSTIAIAMGFMSETVLLNNQRKVLEGLKELGFSDYGSDSQQVAELEIPANAEGDTLLAMLAEFLGLDSFTDINTATAEGHQRNDMMQDQELAHLTGDVPLRKVMADSAKSQFMSFKKAESIDDNQSADVETPTKHEDAVALGATSELTIHADISANASELSLSEIILAWKPQNDHFNLGSDLIDASFAFSGQADSQVVFDLINSETGERIASFYESDTLARQLVEFIETKNMGFGMVSLGNEIIMIDRSAASGGQTEFIQWQSADGKMISLIGLAADFEQFDMIA
jgi:hypothetical protein